MLFLNNYVLVPVIIIDQHIFFQVQESWREERSGDKRLSRLDRQRMEQGRQSVLLRDLLRDH